MGEETAIEELPKTIVRRVVKERLSQCSEAGDISLHKDALLAFSESARVFIHYLSATANDFCKESKRQTMNADDVLKAIEEIEFPEFLDQLNASLQDYRRKNSKKRSGAAKEKEVNKKQKVDAAPENESHNEDTDKEGNNNDQEQNDAEGEDNQDNDTNLDNPIPQISEDRESKGDEDEEQQTADNEEEDAMEVDQFDKQHESDNDDLNTLEGHSPDAV